jgi:hypothetical protein
MSNKFFKKKLKLTTTIDPKKMPQHLGTDDPIVLKTSWRSMNNDGARAQTHTLVKINDNRMEFHLRYIHLWLWIIAIILSFSIPFVLMSRSHVESSGSLAGVGSWVSLLMSILMIFLLFKHITKLGSRIVIDKNTAALWKGRAEASQIINPWSIDGYHSLKNVHAVQIIKKLISGSDRRRFSYCKHEIYLIFNNAERVFLVGHANETAISEQAKLLSEFLNIPLWDGRSNIPLSSSDILKSYKGSWLKNTLVHLVLLIIVIVSFILFKKISFLNIQKLN